MYTFNSIGPWLGLPGISWRIGEFIQRGCCFRTCSILGRWVSRSKKKIVLLNDLFKGYSADPGARVQYFKDPNGARKWRELPFWPGWESQTALGKGLQRRYGKNQQNFLLKCQKISRNPSKIWRLATRGQLKIVQHRLFYIWLDKDATHWMRPFHFSVTPSVSIIYTW